jgi:hypothetical protein
MVETLNSYLGASPVLHALHAMSKSFFDHVCMQKYEHRHQIYESTTNDEVVNDRRYNFGAKWYSVVMWGIYGGLTACPIIFRSEIKVNSVHSISRAIFFAVLAPYQPHLPTVVTCGASTLALGAELGRLQGNGMQFTSLLHKQFWWSRAGVDDPQNPIWIRAFDRLKCSFDVTLLYTSCRTVRGPGAWGNACMRCIRT